MPNQLPPWLEERVVAFALGHPGLGSRRIAAQLALPMWGGQPISGSGVLKVLHRHGLHTRRRRLALVAGYAGRLLSHRPADADQRAEFAEQGSEWPPLKGGLFDGSPDRLKAAYAVLLPGIRETRF